MTNAMTNGDRCPKCGLVYALIGGRVHRCVGDDPVLGKAPVATDEHLPDSEASPRGTYQYRDADKWRAYMRDYMRKRRLRA